MSASDPSPASKADTLRELAAALRQVRERVQSRESRVQSSSASTLNAERESSVQCPVSSVRDAPPQDALNTGHSTLNAQRSTPSLNSQLSTLNSSLLSTGLPPLDDLLPAGGLRRGTFIEWLADGPGTGVERLALSIVPHALRPGGVCLLIDPRQEFFPRGAAAMGIDLDRLIVLRPHSLDDALWAAEQALRCPGVDVVFGWDDLVPRGRAPDRVFRRLQLAAEEGGTLGVLLRPAAVQRQRCWGDLRVLTSPVSSVQCPVSPETRDKRQERLRSSIHALNAQRSTLNGSQESRDKSQEKLRSSINHKPSTINSLTAQHSTLNGSQESRDKSQERRRSSTNPLNTQHSTLNAVPLNTGHSTLNTRLTLLHCRGRLAGMTLILEIDDETGAVRVVSELAGAASAGGAARA